MTDRLSDKIKIDYVYDADGTWADATWYDMKDYDGFMAVALGTSVPAEATNFLKTFKIASNSGSTGGGTDHDIAEAVTTDGGSTTTLAAADMGTTPFTTAGDQVVLLDVGADQMYAGDRYVSVKTTGSGTFPVVFMFIRYNGNYSYKDMFQGTRSAFQYDGDL